MVTTSHPAQPPSAPITPEGLLGGCAASHASILSRARRSREAEPGVAVQAMICTSGSSGVVALDLRICSTANRVPFQPDHLTERFGTFNCPRMSRTCCSAG